MRDIHTPAERLHIPSAIRIYKLLEKIVQELKVLPSSLFYCSEIAEKDNSNINKINTIIAEELSATNLKIQNRLRDIL